MTECERKLLKEKARKRHWQQEYMSLRTLTFDLVDAVKAHDPELVSNDLGNALDAIANEIGDR
jgi:hypothetical protein